MATPQPGRCAGGTGPGTRAASSSTMLYFESRELHSAVPFMSLRATYTPAERVRLPACTRWCLSSQPAQSALTGGIFRRARYPPLGGCLGCFPCRGAASVIMVYETAP
jgi:hypothetical protein